MRPFVLLLAAVAVAACGSPDPEEVSPRDVAAEAEREAREGVRLDLDTEGLSFSSDLPGTVIETVSTRDGALELGVTDSVLFSRLSDDTRAEVEAEMAAETEDETGLGGTIARAVTGAVAEGLATAVSVPLDRVRDVRYEDGRVVIEMADGGASPFDNAKSDDEPMLEQFDAEAGQRIAEAFDKTAGR